MEPKDFGDMKDNKFINNKKIIMKPWGKEIWLELNDKYCYKRIHINAGFKTSYQMHNFKLETNFIIEGKAEVWLENDDGIVEKFIMNSGDFFTVLPPRKHRVIAITDIILQEVSTPEVDDVIRINDEFKRKDGKVQEEHYNPVVCIIAAGTGTRLGKLSDNCHKSLLPLNQKAIISSIIDKFDYSHEIIIAVGHLKDQVIEYINLYHKDRNIKFVNVDPYIGKGSGPAFSLECCKEYLRRPFYFCVSDFYTDEKIQNLNLSSKNWISVKDTSLPELYSTINIDNGKITSIVNKRKDGYSKAFTGIFYMYDHQLFWDEFEKNVDNNKEVVDIFKNIELFNFQSREIELDDMGTFDLYFKLMDKYEKKYQHLHKTKFEHKYHKDDNFIKAGTKEKITKLFERGVHLKNFIPSLEFKGEHFFSYKYFEGKTLYQLNDKNIYKKYLEWFGNNFCKINIKKKDECAYKFYFEKTKSRLELVKSNIYFQDLDSKKMINDKQVLTIDEYFNKIDWEELSNIIPTELFHGDLQFDNILYNGEEFKFIDWREDFGGNTNFGDLYYDLAKMYGGMILNYLKMKNHNNYNHLITGNTVIVNHFVDPILNEIMEKDFVIFLNNNNFDFNRVKLLTALIFLNMAPLHINNFDKFLFLKSKMLLAEIL